MGTHSRCISELLNKSTSPSDKHRNARILLSYFNIIVILIEVVIIVMRYMIIVNIIANKVSVSEKSFLCKMDSNFTFILLFFVKQTGGSLLKIGDLLDFFYSKIQPIPLFVCQYIVPLRHQIPKVFHIPYTTCFVIFFVLKIAFNSLI